MENSRVKNKPRKHCMDRTTMKHSKEPAIERQVGQRRVQSNNRVESIGNTGKTVHLPTSLTTLSTGSPGALNAAGPVPFLTPSVCSAPGCSPDLTRELQHRPGFFQKQKAVFFQ